MISVQFELEPGQDEAFSFLRPGDVTGCLKRAAAQYMRIQRERIRSGLDVDGNAFQPYSASYWNAKSRADRKVDPPDLRLTGQMLRSQAVVAGEMGADTVVQVEFQGMHARAWFKKRGGPDSTGDDLVVHIGGGDAGSNAEVAARVDERRSFVGVSELEYQRLAEDFLACLLARAGKRELAMDMPEDIEIGTQW